MAVYDDEKEKAGTGNLPSDDDLRHITGINPEQEAAHDREAYRGAAEDIAEREGLFNPHGDTETESPKGAVPASGLAAAEAGGAAGNNIPFNPSDTKSPNKLLTWFGRNKKKTAAGGIVGLSIGGLIFGGIIASGPFEFIHLAQNLTHFHFASLQDAGDDRSSKLLRFVFHAQNGEVEKTRMGHTMNMIANGIEAKMNATGIQTAYTDKFGLLDGYAIDTSNENFKGMSEDQVKQYFKENYNVDLQEKVDPSGKKFLFADGKKLGYFKSRAMIRAMMQEAGYSKIGSVLAARIMGRRAGITWHPLKKLDRKLQGAAEKWAKSLFSEEESGAPPEIATEGPENTNNNGSQPTQGETDATNAESSANDTTKTAQSGNVEDTKTSITGKVAAGGAALVGVACLAYGVAKNVDVLKESEVVLPLIRMGMETIIVGNQVMSGQDVDMSELAQLSKQFTSIDQKTGKTLGWDDAQSIQAEQGQQLTGVDATDTMRTVGQAPAGSWLSSGTLGGILGGVCSAPAQLAISFLGGPISGVVSFLIAKTPPVEKLMGDITNHLASWLVGKAIDPSTLAGPDFGNAVNYGARLAANQQAIASGGTELSTAQSAQLQTTEDIASSQQFNTQSLAYRVLNPYDSRTLASHVIDSVSPSTTSEVASLAGGFLHIGSNIAASVGSIFTGTIHAAPKTPYNYGFPEYGFSEADLNNPLVEDPYANAAAVANLLDTNCLNSDGTVNSGCSYISKANKCFGVNITYTPADGSSGGNLWDVVDGGSNVKMSDDSSSNGCDDSSSDWLQVRFFIFDTESAQSLGCYENVAESCSAINMNNGSGSVSYKPTAANQQVGSTSSKEIVAQSHVNQPQSQKQKMGLFGSLVNRVAALLMFNYSGLAVVGKL